jgi:hypothetical protein
MSPVNVISEGWTDGTTVGLRIAAGGDTNVWPNSENSDCAMDITSNGSKFNVGIVIHASSLDTTAGYGSAILLPDNYNIEWYEYESLSKTAYITSQIYNDESPQGLVFAPSGLIYKNGNGNTMFLIQDNQNTVANYLYITSAVASSAPAIYAAGTDSNINIQIAPKGSGYTILGNPRFGTRTVDATASINGYITHTDSSGNTVYLATVTPTP